MVSFVTQPIVWDTVTIAGITFAGQARVRGKVARKLDVKDAPGQDGATLTDLGYQPPQIEITLRLWTDEHLENYDKLINGDIATIVGKEFETGGIGPRPEKGRPSVVEVFHPALSMHGIMSIYVTEMGVLEPGEVRGEWQARLQALGWRPITSTTDVTKTPQQSVGESFVTVGHSKRAGVIQRPAAARDRAKPSADKTVVGP